MKEKKHSLWTWKYSSVLLINILNGLALYISNPIMTKYLVAHGIGFEYTGIISSLLSWIAMGFRPFSGAMSDRMNKKRLMYASYLLTAVCLILYTTVSDVRMIILVRVLHGIAFAVSGTISMSFAIEFIPKDKMAEGISYLGMGTIVGSMLGPQLGTIIFDSIGMSYVFYASAVLCVSCLLCLSLIRAESDNQTEVQTEKLKFENFFAKELLFYVILIAILTLGNGIISYYLVDFGESRNIQNIALFFTVYSIALLIVKPFVGKLQDRMGIKFILYPIFIIYIIGVVILAKAYALLPVLIAAVCKAIGQGNAAPAIQAEAVKSMSLQRRGVAISTCFIGQDIGNAIGPIYSSFTTSMLGYEQMFLLYAGILALGLLAYILHNKRKRGDFI